MGNAVMRDNDTFGGSDCALLTQRRPMIPIYNTGQSTVKEPKRTPTSSRGRRKAARLRRRLLTGTGGGLDSKGGATDCTMVAGLRAAWGYVG